MTDFAVSGAKHRYVTGKTTIEEFEREVEGALMDEWEPPMTDVPELLEPEIGYV